ncbi:ABC transporter ATP-binding protein [Couchioplanes caeruleus]|uniref:Branched-chain amino acid transport system ATP-binding protein n=1 Tax=Couchioplanes caeruleus TaxID=56438 RepID=A0A3N1GP67_9ACTN|nr:ABC transporter ATP-binding protein [Couchioplanes caeruleus]ROP32011.1 branched-chain amino acid transport system ATP-binding protein [Couchioplanes caeruleus]
MTISPSESAGLTLDRISVRFGGLVALDGVSLRVPPGRTVGVIGPNGAGKTTLFNVVCGFVAPTGGSLALDGRPLRPRPHRLARLGISRTLQGVGLFGGLTVLENVLVAVPGRPARALAALDRCKVGHCAGDLPGLLPYALRKRVALARALVSEPRLLLLDEPAGGLGAGEIDELRELIEGLSCAVLLVEHHMDLVMAVCDEILVLDFGRPVAHGTPAEIRTDEAVADAYLGAAA